MTLEARQSREDCTPNKYSALPAATSYTTLQVVGKPKLLSSRMLSYMRGYSAFGLK